MNLLKNLSGSKIWFLALAAFAGLSALNGGFALLIKPDGSLLGIGGLLPALERLPLGEMLFKNYAFSAFLLLIFCAAPNIASAVLIIKENPAGLWLVPFCGAVAVLIRLAKLWAVAPDVYLQDFLMMTVAAFQLLSGIAALLIKYLPKKNKN